MKVALTGASGFLGAAIARCFASGGHRVVGLVRPTSARDHIAPSVVRFVVGDQSDPSVWPDLLDGADALVHNSMDWQALRAGLDNHLSTNLAGAVRLFEAARTSGVNRVVYLSSVAAHHDISPRWNGVIDADHPLRPGTIYGACKAAVEAHLWVEHVRHGVHAASIRPAAVYGVEPVRLERSVGFKQVKAVMEGERVTPERFGGGGKFVHVDDVALAVVRAAERDAANGRAFHLADCYAKHTRFAEHARDLLGLPAETVEPDDGPPAKNRFSKDAERDILGVEQSRGDEGLRAYVGELIEAIRRRGPS